MVEMGSISRRDSLRLGAAITLGALTECPPASAADLARPDLPPRPYLTQGDDFTDVSRGNPVPHSLKGEALIKARLTPETWRLEVITEGKAHVARSLRQADGTAIDLPALLKLGQSKSVLFLKAMQCNNIAQPLGQGLWEGVPLRDVLHLAGRMRDVRRVYYWGYHNDDPAQMFRSSLAINQVLDTPPGELPPFVAYRLNGGPIPLKRGGPVRMVVPWSHGFKSIKWLQNITLTNDYQANDTYALANNDPESYLKTATYLDDAEEATLPSGKAVVIRGTAMVGWPGLDRVEYWLRPVPGFDEVIGDDDPAWTRAEWLPCRLDPAPSDLADGLPPGTNPARIWGFGPDGMPKEWPMRFSIAPWSVVLEGLKPGSYEFRARTVDRNGFAQPEPRPFAQRSGMNAVQCKRFRITATPS
jgi:DMSO/TMAO reductase YedYZ molybdopterin-dependent catalytic subunit